MILTTEQKVKVTVKPLTSKGNPAVVDGPPGWAVSDPSIATLQIDPDGLSAEVFGSGVGSTIITVSADADLTAGFREITGSLNVTVVAAEAVSLTLEESTPTIS